MTTYEFALVKLWRYMTGGNRLEGDNAILLLEFLTLLVGILYSLTQLYYVRVTPAKVRDEWLLIFSVFHCRCTSWGSTTLHPSTECSMYSCCWYVSKRVRHDVASPPLTAPFQCAAQLLWTILGLHIATLAKASAVDWYSTDQYVQVAPLAFLIQVQLNLFSVAVLITWIKLLDYFSVFKRISRFVVILEMVSCLLRAHGLSPFCSS